MRPLLWPALALVALMVLPAAAQAQNPIAQSIEDFEIIAGDTRAEVPVGGFGAITFVFHDLSRDGAGFAAPGGPGFVQHVTRISADPVTLKTGWTVATTTSQINSVSGQQREVGVQFGVEPSATDPFFEANITATFTGASGESKTLSFTAIGYSPGIESFTAQVSETYTLKPGQIVDVPLKLRNTALVPRVFDMEIMANPCDMLTGTTNGNVVDAKSVGEYTVSIRAPAKKIWYAYDSCSISVLVSPQDNPAQLRTAIINVQVAGLFVNPLWVIRLVEILVVLLLIILFVRRRKDRIEEEILGKPQKPWTIPVEALYLKALRAKDERAWYVVRHHLMEEEYRSSLLWYKSYKKATKGSRKKETLVVRQEKSYARWQKKWKLRIARPLKEATRYEAELQRKLDRRADKDHGKQLAKYDTVRRKMEAAHAKQVERALVAWEKDVRKAQKKGLSAPRRPTVPEPDYPEEPQPGAIALADHKWARKAERFRARKVRKQGDLEVRFEKADARRLRKLRRKVRRLARKLDDPQFIEEHPLLRDTAAE